MNATKDSSRTVRLLLALAAAALLVKLLLTPSATQAQSAEAPRSVPASTFDPEDYHSKVEWSQEIQNRMLYQDFRGALALCLEAQRRYPDQQLFRDYEASIREYLQASMRSSSEAGEREDEQLEGIYEEDSSRISLRERLVLQAEQDPLLALQGGVGLHRASTADKMSVLNPFSRASIDLYFSPNLGINLFYYDSHWNLVLEHTPGSSISGTLYSLAFGGSLRFRNKFNDFFNRSTLSFTLDVGMGLYDMFPVLSNYNPQLFLLLGFAFSDRPFYHFWGIEALAGLQIDLSFSVYLNVQANAPGVVRTGNWQAILWQSFGMLRLGLSYRGSISEHYKNEQVFFFQHQFALMVGLEWRTNFQ